jgi:colanic acid/amylovoran biosynthesis glycosyltransferase
MNIVYITAKTPWSSKETFILPEIQEIRRQGHQITVIPLRPGKAVMAGQEAMRVAEISVRLPLIGFKVLGMGLAAAIRHPLGVISTLGRLLRAWRTPRKLLKNLAVFPKGLAVARLVDELKPDHIHAHWASTPSTAAYIAARVCHMPWSFTAHRWDISENNMLQEKVGSAKFVRAISRQGRAEIQEVVGKSLAGKCAVIHMGVAVRQGLNAENQALMEGKSDKFVFSCPAYMVLKKGHRYLIEACGLLKKQGKPFSCWLFGDGPLAGQLRRQVKSLGLEGVVEFKGRWPHDALLGLYEHGSIDTVVLPSIETESGDKEGITVSLIEAMARGVPVISTPTGGIGELLREEAGVLVPEKNSQVLMEAMETLMGDPEYMRTIAGRGRRRVLAEYSIETVVKDLLGLMKLK